MCGADSILCCMLGQNIAKESKGKAGDKAHQKHLLFYVRFTYMMIWPSRFRKLRHDVSSYLTAICAIVPRKFEMRIKG